MNSRWRLKFPLFATLLCLGRFAVAAQDLSRAIASPLLAPDQALQEVQTYAAKRVPPLPRIANLNVGDWEREAARMRQEALDRVMLAGRGSRWRTAERKVEWQETIQAADYRIRKVRFEVLPGMWVPALLYEPAAGTGKRPGVLNFNGHDAAGMTAVPSQTLCLNLAKRGVSVLNVEWFGTGQLTQPGFAHGKLNQLDLVGTGGMTPFYLAMSRALELLLALPDVDAARVGAVGFDGGGWQAMLLGALDTRVRFVGVASGYGSLITSIQFPEDLRDAEYLAYDFCTVGDYLHFTMMIAPRPLLLTYNVKDSCCFVSDRTLSPLVKVAGEAYALTGARTNLQWFINEQNTEHTFDRATRQKFYSALGQAFAPGQSGWPSAEIACDAELRKAGELAVALPATNETFHSLAVRLATKVPLENDVPRRASRLARWQGQQRVALRDLVRAKDYPVEAQSGTAEETGGTQVQRWKLRFGADWTSPAVELTRGKPKATAIVVADQGRSSVAGEVERMLNSGLRVLVMDPFGFGEAKPAKDEPVYSLLIAALGDRPLGVQAGQVAAAARWAEGKYQNGPVAVTAYGPRTSLIAEVAAGLEESAIGGIELHDSWTSLKHLITADLNVEQAPEAFCPGLLELFDVAQLDGLVQPRPVVRLPGK